jgi:hypothetical protein
VPQLIAENGDSSTVPQLKQAREQTDRQRSRHKLDHGFKVGLTLIIRLFEFLLERGREREVEVWQRMLQGGADA